MTTRTRSIHAVRERLAVYGADRLADVELLALVLGGQCRDSARARAALVLDALRDVGSLESATSHELARLPGMGTASAARLVAALALAKRVSAACGEGPVAIQCAKDVHKRLAPRLGGLEQEVFVVLALNVRNVVMCEMEVARGSLTGVEVHPREVMRPLIRVGAAACIVAHNHPSGDSVPSREDLALTRRLFAVGELVGIPVLDHVVITRGGFASLAEQVE